MNDHDPGSAQPDPNEKDPYQEFEERMRRIGDLIVAWFSELTLDQRLSHGIAFIGVAVLIVYTAYTIKLADITHESIVRSQRPWLGKEHVVGLRVSILNTNLVGGELDFTAKNFGHSPALNVGVGAYPFIRTTGDDGDFTSARDEACKWADTSAKVGGDANFPEQIKEYHANVLSRVQNVEKSKMLLVAGCIAYRDQFDTSWSTHHTSFCVMGEIAHLESLYGCGAEEIAN